MSQLESSELKWTWKNCFKNTRPTDKEVHRIIPNLPVFVNDAPWITPPATTWWLKWNTSSEVSCHDNYPVLCFRHNVRSIGLNPNAIPQTVSLAVAANKEQKPVWLIVGAFEQGVQAGVMRFRFRYPTPEQLRAQVYAGLIHGATGIVYFIWDSYIGRPGKIFGISPAPEINYDPQCGNATPIQMIKARALWETTVQINRELAELTPALLSPTDSELNYKVHIEGEAVTDTPIRTLLKKNPNGGNILLTVNLDDAMLNVTYTFPNPLKDVQVLFENSRVISPQPSSIDHFTLHYEPFETHVIQISPN